MNTDKLKKKIKKLENKLKKLKKRKKKSKCEHIPANSHSKKYAFYCIKCGKPMGKLKNT